MLMLEGVPPVQDAGASLRPVSWAELSARLAAARDLRKVLVDDEDVEGSFDAASARWIADHPPPQANYKQPVNLVDLGNRKPANRKSKAKRVLPMPGDRGK